MLRFMPEKMYAPRPRPGSYGKGIMKAVKRRILGKWRVAKVLPESQLLGILVDCGFGDNLESAKQGLKNRLDTRCWYGSSSFFVIKRKISDELGEKNYRITRWYQF